MKQDEIDSMMLKINNRCKFPKYWNDFIERETQNHNYIIKNTKQKSCLCTNCHHTFYDKKVKIKSLAKCPNCGKTYSVASIATYIPSFKKSVTLLQRIDKQIIIRIFEIESFFNIEKELMDKDIQEYCRIIPGKGKFISDCVWFQMGYMHIYHYCSDNLNWRKYNGTRYFSDYPVYPYNKSKLLKGTKLQYAPLKEFEVRFYPYNFIDGLELAGYESFELLWNMKLYNLCFNAKKLNKNGSFYNRFGLSKDYLKFMQDNNIHYQELKLLQLFKIKDIDLIKECSRYNFNDVKFLYKEGILKEFLQSRNYIYPGNIAKLKEIKKFIPLRKLRDYPKGLKELDIYNDYLKMSEKLALNYKTKKDLFPRNLISRHDKLQRKLKITEDMNAQFAAYLRYLELSKYTYENDKYMIFPAPSIDSLKDEGSQQGNCVRYMYLTPYIENKTEIFFIRKQDNFTKSFITLEFKDGSVVQKELPHHSKNFSQAQIDFINKWCEFRQFVDRKEEYRIKFKNKTTKYNLKIA